MKQSLISKEDMIKVLEKRKRKRELKGKIKLINNNNNNHFDEINKKCHKEKNNKNERKIKSFNNNNEKDDNSEKDNNKRSEDKKKNDSEEKNNDNRNTKNIEKLNKTLYEENERVKSLKIKINDLKLVKVNNDIAENQDIFNRLNSEYSKNLEMFKKKNNAIYHTFLLSIPISPCIKQFLFIGKTDNNNNNLNKIFINNKTIFKRTNEELRKDIINMYLSKFNNFSKFGNCSIFYFISKNSNIDKELEEIMNKNNFKYENNNYYNKYQLIKDNNNNKYYFHIVFVYINLFNNNQINNNLFIIIKNFTKGLAYSHYSIFHIKDILFM